MSKYELKPVTSQKSFCGKAHVVIEDDGTRILYSYDTAIVKETADGLFRLWNDWTATTGKHIRAFCGLNKKEFEALPLV